MIFPERADLASACAQTPSEQQTIAQPNAINEKIRLRIFRFPSCIAFTNECTRPYKGYRTGEQPCWLLALLRENGASRKTCKADWPFRAERQLLGALLAPHYDGRFANASELCPSDGLTGSHSGLGSSPASGKLRMQDVTVTAQRG